eukprot:evm.model.scf_1006.2 EVM.evm.TU.scf_1006.2   scf_1006:40914-41531(-)
MEGSHPLRLVRRQCLDRCFVHEAFPTWGSFEIRAVAAVVVCACAGSGSKSSGNKRTLGTVVCSQDRIHFMCCLAQGSSAPVSIPHGAHTWTRTQDALSEVEEEEDGQPKATTFVPPHLMVDKPAIQFSLHGSTAEKKAKLRARNTILQMTGFLEPARATEKGWNHAVEPPADADSGWNRSVGRAIRAPGALTKEFSVTKLDSLDK